MLSINYIVKLEPYVDVKAVTLGKITRRGIPAKLAETYGNTDFGKVERHCGPLDFCNILY